MELAFVHEFVVLAESCNYQVAADSLAISQSTLTKHIQKLELDIGVELFDRSKRNVTLNEYGTTFLEYARKLSRLGHECDHALRTLRSNDDSKICVGFMEVHGQYGLVETLTRFCREHPHFQVSMTEQHGGELKPLLISGKCDFIFTAEFSDTDAAECRHLVYATDRLVAILPLNHPLAHREIISLSELRNERFVEHRAPLELRLFTKLCAQENFTPNVVTSISYSSTVLRMVSQGLGVAVMSERCSSLLDSFDVVRVELEPLVTFNVYMLCLKKESLSPAGREFLKFIKAVRSETESVGSTPQ